MGFHSDAHLMLGSEPTPPEVHAWQHRDYPDTFTVSLDTTDRRGHIALTGSPTQLIALLGRMTDTLIEVATAPGQPSNGQAPTPPAEPTTSS